MALMYSGRDWGDNIQVTSPVRLYLALSTFTSCDELQPTAEDQITGDQWVARDGYDLCDTLWQCDSVTCQWLKKGKTDSVMVWDGLQLLLTPPGKDGWCWYQSSLLASLHIRNESLAFSCGCASYKQLAETLLSVFTDVIYLLAPHTNHRVCV